MIAIKPSRKRPVDRRQTQTDKSPTARIKTWTAPIGGWVTNSNILAQSDQTAIVIQNFLPTKTGVEPRGGLELRGTVPSEVTGLFRHSETNESFAATATALYSFPLGGTGGALTSVVTGQTSGDYVSLETQTDGGAFLTVVNGADDALTYDGSTWSASAITGVNTSLLSYIWAYRNRQFFIEKNTMNAWYLGVNSIAGAATKLPLSGLFNKGGSLLFGSSWSGDSGDGLDDRIVFATDQGEFAVYAGGDPGDPSDWSLQGVYEIGEPLGATAHFRVGGDIIVATKSGFIPLSAAQAKDVSQLELDAVSVSIEPDWRREATFFTVNTPWRAVKWANQNLGLVIGNTEEGVFAVNLETNAWSQITGWAISAIGVLDGRLYIGNGSGQIFQGNVGGSDNGLPFVCRYCGAFDALGSPAAYKTAGMAQVVSRYSNEPKISLGVAYNYDPKFAPPPDASSVQVATGSLWDVADWDVSSWGEGGAEQRIRSGWQSVSAHGFTLAPTVQILSTGTTKLDAEIVSVDLTYTMGEIAVG